MHITGLKVGHQTLHKSGLTVFLLEKPAPCGWCLCGAAPAMREVNLLDPEASVEKIDALVFTGGSAFGLGATNGVMRWLVDQDRGYPTRFGRVPIVPTAAIYDLSKNSAFPSVEDGYAACVQATSKPSKTGRVGAGMGATVGRLLQDARPMSGGIGYASVEAHGVQVVAYALVNSLGDIVSSEGKIIAGAVNEKGHFANIEESLKKGHHSHMTLPEPNTTLIALFTNASFDKAILTRLAKTASCGIARAIRPAFTKYDGDAIFWTSLGEKKADELLVSTLGIQATERAIYNAVADSSIHVD